MAVEPDLLAGTITLTNGSVDFTGTGTSFQLSGVRRGDEFLQIEGQTQWQAMVDTITSNTAGTLVRPWGGATGTYEYRLRYQPDGSRVTAQARNLIELLGNGRLLAIAGAPEPAGVIEILPGGAVQLVPKSSLVSGADYDVQVANPAARTPYDAQLEGFSVLISNMGDGRAAITSRVTATAGVWSDPAYVTGPIGNMPTVSATVDMLPPGSIATVTPTPIPGGTQLDFELPEASGFNNAGVYNAANAYNQDDVARHNRSSFIALQPVPAGESPSSVYPPVDTTYWQVLVMAGQNGTGTGDVVGPAASVNDRIAQFDGTTGKALKDSGLLPDSWLRFVAQSKTPAEKGFARANIGADLLGGFRNKVINGDFDFWQRSVSIASLGYAAEDRFSVSLNGCVITSRLRGVHVLGQTLVPGNPKYYVRETFTSVAGAANYYIRTHSIEGVQTFAGKKATLTFYARADSVRNVGIEFSQEFGSGGAPSATVSIPCGLVALGTNWQRFNIVVDLPSIAGKTLGTSGDALRVLFWMNAGSDLAVRSSGVGQGAGGQAFEWSHISLVEGDATAEPDPFSPRHPQQEFALCQRYYQVLKDVVLEASSLAGNFMYPTPMRVSPTLAGGGAGFASTGNSPASAIMYQTARGIQTITMSAEI